MRRDHHTRDSSKKSPHHKKQTRRRPASADRQNPATDIDQNHDGHPEQELKSLRSGEKSFNIVVDSVPYLVKAVPFSFNGETRYRVSFNRSSEHVFTWDSSLGQLRAIDDDSSTIPDSLEIAISQKLLSMI
jgi:hypothetical protein